MSCVLKTLQDDESDEVEEQLVPQHMHEKPPGPLRSRDVVHRVHPLVDGLEGCVQTLERSTLLGRLQATTHTQGLFSIVYTVYYKL